MFGGTSEPARSYEQHKLTRRRIHASGIVNATISFYRRVVVEPHNLRDVADEFGSWCDPD
jgi:hypothetical protein